MTAVHEYSIMSSSIFFKHYANGTINLHTMIQISNYLLLNNVNMLISLGIRCKAASDADTVKSVIDVLLHYCIT